MKNAFCFLLLAPLFVCGQKDTLQKGVELTAFVSNNGYYLCFNPNFFIGTGKHVFGAGPVFTKMPDAYTGKEYRTELTGIHLFYKVRPNPEGNRFTFYFRCDVLWQTYRNLFYSYTSYDNRLENYFGYGFNMRLGKNLFITQNLGLGVHYITRQYTGPAGNISHSEDWEEGATAGIGIGYVFRGR